MIKKFSEALLEFQTYRLYETEEENSSDFEEKFKRFKEFLSGTSASGQTSPTPDPSVASSYSEGSPTTFKDVDKMIQIVVKYLNKYGITNTNVQKAILATIAKESGFTASQEASYKTTPPARIREVFGSRFANMSDEEINALKKDDNAFWEKVYGGEWGKKNLGNTQPGDGAKYLGRGFNGITGRANYKYYTDLLKKSGSSLDILSNPEILEKSPDASAEVNALYFLTGLNHPAIKKKYGNKDQNDFKDFQTALKAAVNANAGAGTDITRGFAKQSYDAAVAANSRMGSKFDKAIAGPSDASRTA